MKRWLLVAAFLSAGACGWMNEPCPCGRSFERDPWNEDATLSVGSDHAVGVHCVCRCGAEGEPVLQDPSSSCERYETSCTLADGEPATYACD